MNETMILPVLRESDLSDEDFEQLLPDGPASSVVPKPKVSNRKWWLGGSAAAILILGISILLSIHGHEAASASAPVPIAFAPTAFTRDIVEVKTAIPMHDTGDQATPGGADPNWQIVSLPADPKWQARPTMVPRGLQPMYTKFVAAGSWIAVNAQMDDQPVGIFTFRTMVDLTGFDPASVSISANVAADDYVADIRVNGVSTGLSTDSKLNLNGHQKGELAIPATFWHPGVNQVDVLVMNKPITFKPNCMALHVDWAASGLAVVHR